MVTTRSQDRKLEENELPVRFRSEGIMSSPTLKRPRISIEEVPSTKRLRTESRTPVDFSRALQAPAPSSEATHDALFTNQSDQAVAVRDSAHLADGSTHTAEQPLHATVVSLPIVAEEVNSDQQRLEHLRHDPLKSAGHAAEAAISMNEGRDSLASPTGTNNFFTPKTGPFQVHKRFGSEGAETDLFVTPETSRKKDATVILPPTSVQAPLSSALGRLPQQADLHATSSQSAALVAPHPPLSPIRTLRRYPRPKLTSLTFPVKSSSSISRYRQTMIERHKRTPFWGGRKARFVDVRAQ